MPWWIYKCNSRQPPAQVVYGDWDVFFAAPEEIGKWGSTEWAPSLSKLNPGDRIIAYQTDRNELVGLAEVVSLKKRGPYRDLYLRRLKTVCAKVRPLKQADSMIAAIPSLCRGPIMAIYEISDVDAHRLLRAAGAGDALAESTPTGEDEAADERHFLEGEKRAVVGTARNPQLRLAAKRKWGLKCYSCGFQFERFYGAIAAGSAVVHHLKPFTDASGKRRKATVEDVRVVCANCHYVLHLTNPAMHVEDLKAKITERWHSWTDQGLEHKR